MKKLMIIVVMATAGLLSACVNFNPMQDQLNNQLNNLRDTSLIEVTHYSEEVHESLARNGKENTLREAQEATRRTLKDPESATFRSLRISKYDGLEVVCGEVNAKNSYGGYVGYQRFVAGISGATTFQTDSRYPDIADAENFGLNNACGD